MSIHQTEEYKQYLKDQSARININEAAEMWVNDMTELAKTGKLSKVDKLSNKDGHLKVLTWNVHMGMDALKQNRTEADMVEILKKIDPDVICLQEYKRGGPLAEYIDEHCRHMAICDTVEGISNVICSNYPLLDQVCFPLSDYRVCTKSVLDLKDADADADSKSGPRKPISVYNVHLTVTGSEESRLAELRKLAELMDNDDNPKILLGDFNAPFTTDKKIQKLLKDSGFRNIFPSGGPSINATSMYGHIVDYIFYTGLKCKNAQAFYTPASDHIPLMGCF